MPEREVLCPGCHMEATLDRWDWALDSERDRVYTCPVCGYMLGPNEGEPR